MVQGKMSSTVPCSLGDGLLVQQQSWADADCLAESWLAQH